MLFPSLILNLFILISQSPDSVFKEQTIDASVSIGYGLALGDVDGDGKTDILLADKKQFVWYRNGDWKKFVLAENLTKYDNVCIAAEDIDGDGKVEIAVGGQWNPGETSNAEESGAVFYLIRPADPTQTWKPFRLMHEPTVHRMRWVKSSNGKHYLLVLPLHGRENKGGSGKGVNFLAYEMPGNVESDWPMYLLDSTLHLTHNFDPVTKLTAKQNGLYIASKEGIRFLAADIPKKIKGDAPALPGISNAAGEVRAGRLPGNQAYITTVEAMHGSEIALYHLDNAFPRVVLDNNVKEGHALATADLLGAGYDQVVGGWRNPNNDGLVGIKIYYLSGKDNRNWTSSWIDRNGMACEDLQIADLNADGKPDIIAAGRATRNLKVYWNGSE